MRRQRRKFRRRKPGHYRDKGIITDVTNNSSSNPKTITVTYTANTTTEGKTGLVTVKDSSSTPIGYLNVNQNGVGYNFSWNQSAFSVGSADTSTVAGFTTNYNVSDLTFEKSGMITNVTPDATNKNVTATYPASTNTGGTNQGTITAKYGTTVLGTVTITQGAKAYFTWVSSSPISVGSGATSTTLTYSTNYASISFDKDGTVVNGTTGTSTGVNVTVTVSITANDRETTREGWVKPSVSSDQIRFNQAAKAYFRWTDSSKEVESADTSTTFSYQTNYTSVSFSKAGIIDSVTDNGGSVTVTFTANPDTSSRTGTTTAYGQTATVIQKAKYVPPTPTTRNCTLYVSGSSVQIINQINGNIEVKVPVQTDAGYIDNAFGDSINVGPESTETLSSISENTSSSISATASSINVSFRVICDGATASQCTLTTSNGELSADFDGDTCELPATSISITPGDTAITVAIAITQLIIK